MKVLAFTNLFPSSENPGCGIFLRHRLRHFARSGDVSLRVMVPIPWFPLKRRWFGKYAAFARTPDYDLMDGTVVRYQRYFLIPKIGMWLSPIMMALSMANAMKRLIASGIDPDMIDAYYLYPDGVAACLVGKWFRKPVILTALGSDVSLIATRLVPRMMIRWALRQAVATTAVCKALVVALEDIGAEPAKLHVVEHGVDLDLFAVPPDRHSARRTLSFHQFTILSVGALIPRKGHYLAIEALRSLPYVDLVIMGSGPDRRGLEALAKRLGVSRQVKFAGHVDQPTLANMLAAADLLINCSDREGIANVLLEALACGTPVAATPIWGSPEVIASEDIGLLFAARTADAIAAGIATAQARTWDRSAIRQYAKRYSWSQTAENHHRIIVDILEVQAAQKRAAPCPHNTSTITDMVAETNC